MLALLGPVDAEDLARRMIAAEAASAGIRIDQIYTSGNAPSPDGDIDFVVRDAPKESDTGLIKKGHTAYQVKSGAFVHSRDIARTMFKKDGRLKDGMRKCLDSGGTLVVILTGWRGSGADADGLEGRFARALSDRSPEYAGLPVRVWNLGKIRSLLDRHPRLSLLVSVPSAGLCTHAMWASHPDMRQTAHLGPEQRRFIDDLRGLLRSDDGEAALVLVTGAPGAGKTRLVLEATRGDAYSKRIVYTNQPGSLRPLLNRVAVSESDFSDLVIVVDDFTYSERDTIWHEVKACRGMRLVAISGEPGQDGINRYHMSVPDLDDVQIGQIISEYSEGGEEGKKKDLAMWIGYSRPSPRVAHIVGENLRKNPGDASSQPVSVPVWERHIAGRYEQGSADAEVHKIVLRWISLFKTLRREGIYMRELECVASLAKENHNISRGQFMDTVERLRAMKVLQGESEIYITPKLLHLHMWAGWWKTYTAGMAPGPDRLVEVGSRRLFQSYIDMFKYAKDAPETAQIIRDMLAPGGFLESDRVLKSRLGADFFLTFSSIDPPSALAYAERAFGRAKGEDPSAGLGCRTENVAHALRMMLWHAGAFAGAMRLLLRLAAAREGARGSASGYYRNPALDSYCNALDPAASGPAAPTATPLPARLDVIGSAMRSESAEERRVAVRACGAVIGMRKHSIAMPNYEGGRPIPDPWTPSDRRGAVAYYLGVLEMIGGAALGDPDHEVRCEAAGQAVETLWQAALVPELAPQAVEIVEKVYAAGRVPDIRRLLEQIGVLLDIESGRIDAGIAARLAALRGSVEGSGFSAELRRGVGKRARIGWGDAYRAHADRTRQNLQRLADAAVHDGLRGPDMDWLVAEDGDGEGAAEGAFEFGLEVATRDEQRRIPAAAIGAMRAAAASSPSFLGGYLRGMRDGGDGEAAEEMLDGILLDGALCRHLPALTRMAGASDRAVRRLAGGVSKGRLSPKSLGVLCAGRILADGVSDGALSALVCALLESHRGDPAAGAAALGLLHACYLPASEPPDGGDGAPRGIPLQPALDVLLHGSLLGSAVEDHGGVPKWEGLCAAFVRQHPDCAPRLAEAAIARLCRRPPAPALPVLPAPPAGSDPLLDVLTEAARLRPREVWDAVASRLASAEVGGDKQVAHHLYAWIKAGAAARVLPMPDVMRWAEERPDERPASLSRSLPPDFAAVRDFVARFGGDRDVRACISGAFLMGAYEGSILSHYAGKRAQALRLYRGENDPNVLAWLDHHIESIDACIAQLAPEAGLAAAEAPAGRRLAAQGRPRAEDAAAKGAGRARAVAMQAATAGGGGHPRGKR